MSVLQWVRVSRSLLPSLCRALVDGPTNPPTQRTTLNVIRALMPCFGSLQSTPPCCLSTGYTVVRELLFTLTSIPTSKLAFSLLRSICVSVVGFARLFMPTHDVHSLHGHVQVIPHSGYHKRFDASGVGFSKEDVSRPYNMLFPP